MTNWILCDILKKNKEKRMRKSPRKEITMMTAVINVNLYSVERCYELEKEHSFLCVRFNKLSRFRHDS